MITERYMRHNPSVSYILFKSKMLGQNNTFVLERIQL